MQLLQELVQIIEGLEAKVSNLLDDASFQNFHWEGGFLWFDSVKDAEDALEVILDAGFKAEVKKTVGDEFKHPARIIFKRVR